MFDFLVAQLIGERNL